MTEVTYYRWRKEYGGLKGDQVKRLKELETENERLAARGLRSDAGEADPRRGRLGKLLSPARRRACVDHVVAEARRVRAAGVPGSGAASIDTAQGADEAGR